MGGNSCDTRWQHHKYNLAAWFGHQFDMLNKILVIDMEDVIYNINWSLNKSHSRYKFINKIVLPLIYN